MQVVICTAVYLIYILIFDFLIIIVRLWLNAQCKVTIYVGNKQKNMNIRDFRSHTSHRYLNTLFTFFICTFVHLIYTF